MLLLQVHIKISNKYYYIKKLKANYKIRNQFDHSLNPTNAKLSRKWSKVRKCIGVQVS